MRWPLLPFFLFTRLQLFCSEYRNLFIYLFIYACTFMFCSYLQDAPGRFCSGFVMRKTGRKTQQFTWRDIDEMKVAQSVQNLRVSFQNTKYVSLTMLAGTLCYIQGLGMSAIVPVRSGNSKRKRDTFASGTGIYYWTLLHVKLVTWSAGGRISVRFLLRASRVIQQCAVASHSQNTVWRSCALTHPPTNRIRKYFRELEQATVFAKL